MFFFFQAEDGIRDLYVTGVQTCALPISEGAAGPHGRPAPVADLEVGPEPGHAHRADREEARRLRPDRPPRSEEHTSELQSRRDLVCRLLLEKKKPSTRSTCRYACRTSMT